jgi:hypothetical protein
VTALRELATGQADIMNRGVNDDPTGLDGDGVSKSIGEILTQKLLLAEKRTEAVQRFLLDSAEGGRQTAAETRRKQQRADATDDRRMSKAPTTEAPEDRTIRNKTDSIAVTVEVNVERGSLVLKPKRSLD